MLVSDTTTQAKDFIESIKHELETNEKLIADFGNLVGDDKWSSDEIVTFNDVHVIAKSSGQNLRGANHHGTRPDFIVLDDMENDEAVETEAQRAKLKNWFEKALLPCGDPKTVAILYVGTVLHYESLLYTILTNVKYTDWNRKIYKAVISFSESPLWQEWEEIYTDLSLDDPSEQAHDFYLAHQKEMLEGVEILWENQRDEFYYQLMIIRLQNDEAFNSEYQNNPMTEEMRTFKEEWIKSNYYTVLPKMKEIYGSVDLSMGKTRTADTSAIIFVGRGIDNFLYVLEADVCRRSPDKIITDIIMYLDKYDGQLNGFIVETNVFQEFFSKTLQKQCLDMGLYVNWIEQKSVGSKDNKGIRIRSLAPKIKNGYIKFNEGHRTLISQLKNFPKDHDDAPDALERCISKFTDSSGKVFISSVKNHVIKDTKSLLKNIRGWR